MKGFLQRFTFNNIMASTAKRVGLWATEGMIWYMLMPAWLSTPLRFAAGTASKSLFWWAVSPKEKSKTLDEPIVFVGEEEALKNLQLVVMDENQSAYRLSFQTIQHKIKKTACGAINGAANYTVEYAYSLTTGDLMEMAGAAVGSGIAGGALFFIVGPPSLALLPACYIADGICRGTFAHAGRYAGEQFLGPRVAKPIIKTYLSKADEEHMPISDDSVPIVTKDEGYEALFKSFELMNFDESPSEGSPNEGSPSEESLNDKAFSVTKLLEEHPAKGCFTLFEDYHGAQVEPLLPQADCQSSQRDPICVMSSPPPDPYQILDNDQPAIDKVSLRSPHNP